MQWITLEDAEREGLDLSWVADSIGPLRKGTVYRDHYWGTVNTVTRVMVCVEYERESRVVRRWEVTEYSGWDSVRDRTHVTSWEYGAGTVLHGPGDIRPRTERG